MKISEMIKVLQQTQTKQGDIELFSEQNDGYSTWAEPATISIQYREIWHKHPAGKKWFVSA